MGVVIGKMDGQVEKIFLGNNLTRSTKNYAKILKDENLSEEEKQRILAAEKKKQEEDIRMIQFTGYDFVIFMIGEICV